MRVITTDLQRMGGVPCFDGTRVPVATLFDHLKHGYNLTEFLADFPTVPRHLAEAAIDLAIGDLPSHAVSVDDE